MFRRKPNDELPTTPISISHLNWSADEDKTFLVNSATAMYNPGNINSMTINNFIMYGTNNR